MPSHPYVVPVASLLRQAGASLQVAFSTVFDPDGDLAAPTEGASEVPRGSDVEVRLTLTSYLGGGIAAAGSVGAPWHAACRRCAKPVQGRVHVEVNERFSPSAGPDDDEAYPLVDELVDLEDLVRDAVVLELPLAPLCRDDCAGLCPICGADLNEGACGCRPAGDPRWATLDALRVPEEA